MLNPSRCNRIEAANPVLARVIEGLGHHPALTTNDERFDALFE